MNTEEKLRELLGCRGGVGPPVGAPPWVQVNLAHAHFCCLGGVPSDSEAPSMLAERPSSEGERPATGGAGTHP
jgi:hypothetical protein